jgi:hypothetical protein
VAKVNSTEAIVPTIQNSCSDLNSVRRFTAEQSPQGDQSSEQYVANVSVSLGLVQSGVDESLGGPITRLDTNRKLSSISFLCVLLIEGVDLIKQSDRSNITRG